MRISLFVLLLAVGSCKPAADRTVPDLYWLQPVAASTWQDGDTLPWVATLVDNWALASYQLSIAPAFDSLTRIDLVLPALSQQVEQRITGTTEFIDTAWILPDSVAAGTYRLTMQATDAAGTTAQITRDVVFQSALDGLPPIVDSVSVTDSLLSGTPITLYLETTDSVALAYTTIRVERSASGAVQGDTTFALSGVSDMLSLQWPLDLSIGLYRIRIIVVDWANNRRSQTFNLLVYV